MGGRAGGRVGGSPGQGQRARAREKVSANVDRRGLDGLIGKRLGELPAARTVTAAAACIALRRLHA